MNTGVIFAQQLADVVRRLRDQGIRDTDPQLYVKFQNAFQGALGGTSTQPFSQINIQLPNLEDDVQADIVPDNIKAVAALYFAAQLEELKFFAVVDKVAEQFQTGVIPTTRGAGGDAIYRYIKDAPQRLAESERRSIYARAFGFAQGSVDEPMPNREFADLWIRFISAVSILTREQDAQIRKALTMQQVFKNARDLAVNISLHGYGIAHFAAVELQEQVTKLMRLLSFPDVLAAYGVNDRWQLVERVSGLYLGGAANSVRQRTLAQSGARIILWLAANQALLSNGDGAKLDVKFFQLDPQQQLVSDIERWLAVTGTDDVSIDKFSEPVAVASQPTIPNLSLQAVPDALQNMLTKPNGLLTAVTPTLGSS